MKIKLPKLAICALGLSLAACSTDEAQAPVAVADAAAPQAETPMESRYPATPDPDAFYAQPSPMPKVPAGTLLNSRAVTFAPGGVPLPNPAWQLQYMSTDLRGRPQTAIATVVQPLLPALTGNKPLLSYQFAINSPGLKCAPSHQVTGSTDNSNSQLEILNYLPLVQTQGWTLIFPDHLGPTSSTAIGRIAAPIVLDGMRAALSFAPLGLAAGTPIGMMGYSGGALATTWAAALQPTYAPELNIVGVAAGGLPANIEVTLRAFDGSPFFDIAFAAVISAARVFPQVLPPGLLNEKGERTAEAVKDGCLGGTTDGSPAPTGTFADYVTVDDLYATPGAQEVFPQLAMPQPGEVPTAEIYFYHQTLDQLAPLEPATQVVDVWCAAGARIHQFQDLTGEHFAGAATATPSELLFLISRFAGTPMPVLPPTTRSCN